MVSLVRLLDIYSLFLVGVSFFFFKQKQSFIDVIQSCIYMTNSINQHFCMERAKHDKVRNLAVSGVSPLADPGPSL